MGDTPNTAGTKEVPMPWREASPMDQRTQFIADHLRDTGSITEGRRDMKDPNKGTATFCAPNIDPDFAISQHSLAKGSSQNKWSNSSISMSGRWEG